MSTHGLFLLLAVLTPSHAASPGPTQVVLVRHAEKQSGDNPSLTAAGQARARRLEQMLAHTPVHAIFSTDLCRTIQTVMPIATARDMPIHLVAASKAGLQGCNPRVDDRIARLPDSPDPQADLVSRIRNLPQGSTVVVAGHSNTVPALAESLGSGSLCPEVLPLDENGHCWIHHDDYDNIFMMSLDSTGPASVLRLSLPLAE